MANLIDDIFLYIAKIIINDHQHDTLWSFGSTSKYIRRILVNNKIWHDLRCDKVYNSIIKHDHIGLWKYLIDTQTEHNIGKMFPLVLKYRAINIFSYYEKRNTIKLGNELNISINTVLRYISYLKEDPDLSNNSNYDYFDKIISKYNHYFLFRVDDHDRLLNIDYAVLCAFYTENFRDVDYLQSELNEFGDSDGVSASLLCYDIVPEINIINSAIINKVLSNTQYHRAKNLTRYLLLTHIKEIEDHILVNVLQNPLSIDIADIAYKELHERNNNFSINTSYNMNVIGLEFCLAHGAVKINPNSIYGEVGWCTDLQCKLHLLSLCSREVMIGTFSNIARIGMKNKMSSTDLVVLYKFALRMKINTNCIPLKKYVQKNFNDVNVFSLLRELYKSELKLDDINLSNNFVASTINIIYKQKKLNYGIVCKNKWLVTKMCSPKKEMCIWDMWWRVLGDYDLI